MKLSYRGTNYEFTSPTLEVTEGEILGKYRGANWRCHTLAEAPIPQPNAELSYRGVVYNTNSVAGNCINPSVGTGWVKASKPAVSSRTLAVRHALEEVHRSNLQRNLERRLQAARAQGDERLVNLLEAESRQLVEL